MKKEDMVSYTAILQELERAQATRPHLAAFMALHIAMIRLQAQVAAPLTVAPLATPEGAPQMSNGQPWLSADSIGLEPEALAEIAQQTVRVTEQHRPDLAKPLAAIVHWLADHRGSLVEDAWAVVHESSARVGVKKQLDRGLLSYVLINALHPFLRAQAERAALLVDDAAWHRGYCPVCGGSPDFAALVKDSGYRRLLCALCDTEWSFYRTTCPFCGDEKQVSYYTGEAPYRIYVCGSCRRYLKTIDLREAAGEHLLPVERILTIEADTAAQAAGWRAFNDTSY